MEKKIIHTDSAPPALGAYSQGVRVAGFIYTAGQIGIDVATGALVGPDIESQTQAALANLNAILQAADADFSEVVKTTIYLTDLADFGVVNEIYGIAIGEARPARVTVQVAALPLGALIEIDMIALDHQVDGIA